ncbi:MAG: hypothetical protein JST22_16365 [Bacteroidetes bacterium]|nr:hypothetical protein [Bacteroidota bacterium]
MNARPQPDWITGGNRRGAFRSRPAAAVLTLLVSLVSCTPQASAQLTNLDVLGLCARQVCDSALASQPDSSGFCAVVIRHPASWLVEENMAQAAASHGMQVRSCDSDASVTIALRSIGVAYDVVAGDDDHVSREASIEVSALLRSSGGAIRETHYRSVRRDTVAADQVPRLDGSGYDFTRGTQPAQPGGGFWSRVVEPAVVIGASVVMTILFFTVRSQ